MPGEDLILRVEKMSRHFGGLKAVDNVSFHVRRGEILGLIGPNGAGKTTCFNVISGVYRPTSGQVFLDGRDILSPDVDPLSLRKRIGMIFQKPTPFPMSIFDNVAYGLRLHYRMSRAEMAERVELALKGAALWDEVKDKLDQPGAALSGGQQQRLCIARAIAVEPEVLLMDEPCSAIDPVATSKIEDLIETLKSRYTIVIVTHNMQQAARVSAYTAFFYQGRIVEFGHTEQIFKNPKQELTEKYITGRFG